MPFDGAFSPLHWLVIAVVAFLVLGPKDLPVAARKAGQAMRDLRRIQHHLGGELGDLVGRFDDAAPTMPSRNDTERTDAGDDQGAKENS